MMDMPSGDRPPLPGTEAAMKADYETFEVITVDGLRWQVKARNARDLDGDIDRGVILEATVRGGLGTPGWRVNAAQITAFRSLTDA